MAISESLNASNAYQNMARQIKQGTAGGDKSETGSGEIGTGGSSNPNFMNMVEQAARESIDTMKIGEQETAKAITGDTTLPELVQAVSSAETTLQTTIAVRDKMLSAYQEILRMPI